MRADLPQAMRSFPTGDVSSPLEMRILVTYIYASRSRRRIPRRKFGRISKLRDM